MGKSYKTTIAGIIAILGALSIAVTALMNGTPVDWTAVATGVTIGIGLIFAKDGQVTGGTITQPTVPNKPTEVEK